MVQQSNGHTQPPAARCWSGQPHKPTQTANAKQHQIHVRVTGRRQTMYQPAVTTPAATPQSGRAAAQEAEVPRMRAISRASPPLANAPCHLARTHHHTRHAAVQARACVWLRLTNLHEHPDPGSPASLQRIRQTTATHTTNDDDNPTIQTPAMPAGTPQVYTQTRRQGTTAPTRQGTHMMPNKQCVCLNRPTAGVCGMQRTRTRRASTRGRSMCELGQHI